MTICFRPAVSIALVLLAAFGMRAPATQAAGPVFSLPKQYYLSLGDSVSFGYQQHKELADVKATGTADPASFTTGYTDDFARMIRAVDAGIQVVNLACPGETTDTFMHGNCSYPYPLHVSYAGSQMDAAVAFLRAHPGQVGAITLFLGANDILHLVDGCGGISNLNCVISGLPDTLKKLQANLSTIVTTLQAAAPTTEFLLMTIYNPFASQAPETNALAQPVLDIYGGLASTYNVRLVNVYHAFNLVQPQPQTLCTETLVCDSLHDIHPSDIGYLNIAKLVWAASGYDGLGGGTMVSWNSAAPGGGEVYFGPSCSALVEVATRDVQTANTPQHSVFVTGNDMPGTVGNNGLVPGVPYFYETVTVTKTGVEVDDNGGKCYQLSVEQR